MTSPEQGIALWCDPQGTIKEILSNEAGLPDDALIGRKFTSIISEAGLSDALNFMAALNKDGHVFDLLVNSFAGASSTALQFVAVKVKNGLFIAGHKPGCDQGRFIDYLLDIYVVSKSIVRGAVKKLLSAQLAGAARDSSVYDDLTSLNNELVNMQREVSKKNAQLEKALAEIKTLRGILPICSVCKRIRDDKGYWHQVEVYIRKHSNAEFSHSICRECAKKLYPEIYKDRK
jgi:hypothetical protein